MFLIYDTRWEPTHIKTSAVLDEVVTLFARHSCVSQLEYCFPFFKSLTCALHSKQGHRQDFINTEVVILRPPLMSHPLPGTLKKCILIIWIFHVSFFIIPQIPTPQKISKALPQCLHWNL